MNEKSLKAIQILDAKERVLSEIIVWLRSKSLWEDCKRDLVTWPNLERALVEDKDEGKGLPK